MATFARNDGAMPVLAEWDLRHNNSASAEASAAAGLPPDTETDAVDDFESLRLAALEQVPMERRSRLAILPKSGGAKVADDVEVADVQKLTPAQRRILVDRALETHDQDTEKFLRKLKARMDRVGIRPATVEVRFEALSVKADIYVGSRSMSTLLNEPLNMLTDILTKLRLLRSSKRELVILDNVSGIIPPGRLTLLLGPPSAGKTTLLKALAGKLHSVKESGSISYNGEDVHGGTFISARTDVFNILGALYVAILFIGIINSMTVQPVVGAERPVFFREQAAGMYSVFPFNLAQLVVEIPYNFFQVSLYCLITFFMIGFQITFVKFAWYWLITFMTLVLFTAYGLMAVSLTPNVPVANVLSSTFYGLWNLLAGFVIPAGAIPGWWVWMWAINPVSWALYGVIITQLGDYNDRLIKLSDGSFQSVPDFLDDTFNYKYSMRGWVILILAGFAFTFAMVSAIAQKKLNFSNR